jgi:uncharacterized protein with GYD domain
MATYLMTFCYTEHGLEEVRNSPARADAAKQLIRELGGEVKTFLAVLGGPFDTLFIVEAPDDKTVARMALSIGALGNVRTTTHRAFSEQEFRDVASGLR